MSNTNFTVTYNGKEWNCYLNNIGEVWIIEDDNSETSGATERPVTRLEEAKEVAIAYLKGFGK